MNAEWAGIAGPPPLTESAFFNAAVPTVFLLVESGFDEKFWQGHVDGGKCQVRSFHGRDSVLRQILEANATGTSAVIAVLDADFDRVHGGLKQVPGVIWTDYHDLEMTLFLSPALHKVLHDISSADKLHKCGGPDSVRDKIVSASLPLARLRLHSLRQKLNLAFRKLSNNNEFRFIKYKDFFDKTSFTTDIDAMIETVKNFSNRHDLDTSVLASIVRQESGEDSYQMCVGHDVLGILETATQHLCAQRSDAATLGRYLRLAFEGEHLLTTTMFHELSKWEQENPPYRILRRDESHGIGSSGE